MQTSIATRRPNTTRTSGKKREATPEQKAAAAERRSAIRCMLAKIKALPTEKRVLLAHSLGVRSCEEGREFSPTNQILLHMQKPTVSIVGGFDQWRKVGRVVRKGARALAIWVPIGTGKDRDGEPSGTLSDEVRFVIGNVFDIADTVDASLVDAADTPLALPAPAAPITDNARLLEYGADPAALAAADEEHAAALTLA